MKKFLRKTGQITDMIPLAALITFLLVLLGQLVGKLLLNRFQTPELAETNPALSIGIRYFQMIGIWIVFLPVIALPKNRTMFKGLMPNSRGNNWKGILAGLLLGFGMNGFCAIMSILLKDISISLWYPQVLPLIILFFCVFVQSAAEELVCRLYLYQKLARRYKNPLVACIGNAVLFGLLHIINPGLNIWAMIQIIAIGILFSVLVYYYDSIYAAFFVHTAWNFCQNMLFGLPNSGIVSPYSLFHLDAASDGLFFDSKFGIEGSLGADILIIIVLIALVVYARKKNLKPVDLWAEEEAKLLEAEAGTTAA